MLHPGSRFQMDADPLQTYPAVATQASNRGMRLEAIAALLGHQKMEMALIYADRRPGRRRPGPRCTPQT